MEVVGHLYKGHLFQPSVKSSKIDVEMVLILNSFVKFYYYSYLVLLHNLKKDIYTQSRITRSTQQSLAAEEGGRKHKILYGQRGHRVWKTENVKGLKKADRQALIK